MTDLQALLDQIDRLDQEASSAPWNTSQHWAEIASGPDSVIHGYYDGECPACAEKINDAASVAISREDLELIVLARTVLPQLGKAIRAVLSECDRFQRNATALQENPLADHSDDVRAESWRVMASFITEAITDAIGGADDE